MTPDAFQPAIPDAAFPWRARAGDRSLWPDLTTTAYLNHAAVSAPSVAVRATLATMMDGYARLGLGAIHPWIADREVLRERLARLVGAPRHGVALPGTTTFTHLEPLGHPASYADEQLGDARFRA